VGVNEEGWRSGDAEAEKWRCRDGDVETEWLLQWRLVSRSEASSCGDASSSGG